MYVRIDFELAGYPFHGPARHVADRVNRHVMKNFIWEAVQFYYEGKTAPTDDELNEFVAHVLPSFLSDRNIFLRDEQEEKHD